MVHSIKLGFELYEKGYKNITNIDLCQEVIQYMNSIKGGRDIEFIQMDAMDMKFKDGTFDVVIDKGCCDSMWTATDTRNCCKKSQQEIYRILTPTGKFLMFSVGFPEDIYRFFAYGDWEDASYKLIAVNAGIYYAYVASKSKMLDDKSVEKSDPSDFG